MCPLSWHLFSPIPIPVFFWKKSNWKRCLYVGGLYGKNLQNWELNLVWFWFVLPLVCLLFAAIPRPTVNHWAGRWQGVVPSEGMERVSGVWVLLPLREKGQALWCFKIMYHPNGPSALANQSIQIDCEKRGQVNECFVGFVWEDKKSPNPCGSLCKSLGREAVKTCLSQPNQGLGSKATTKDNGWCEIHGIPFQVRGSMEKWACGITHRPRKTPTWVLRALWPCPITGKVLLSHMARGSITGLTTQVWTLWHLKNTCLGSYVG